MRHLVLAALFAAPAYANIPAAFHACRGIEDGEPCQRPAGLAGGRCVRDTLCTPDEEDPDTDECLLCHDACFGQDVDTDCLQANGEPGVCVALGADVCTENEATSFKECHRCEAGETPTKEPEDGCASVDSAAAIPWALLLLIGAFQLRRRRMEDEIRRAASAGGRAAHAARLEATERQRVERRAARRARRRARGNGTT